MSHWHPAIFEVILIKFVFLSTAHLPMGHAWTTLDPVIFTSIHVAFRTVSMLPCIFEGTEICWGGFCI
jgi:hypothetical protein